MCCSKEDYEGCLITWGNMAAIYGPIMLIVYGYLIGFLLIISDLSYRILNELVTQKGYDHFMGYAYGEEYFKSSPKEIENYEKKFKSYLIDFCWDTCKKLHLKCDFLFQTEDDKCPTFVNYQNYYYPNREIDYDLCFKTIYIAFKARLYHDVETKGFKTANEFDVF